MLIRDLKKCPAIIAGDHTVLRELLRPDKAALKLRYSLAHATVLPGRKSVPHRLRTSEVYYILSGKGIMHINNEQCPVRAGRAIYIPPNARSTSRIPAEASSSSCASLTRHGAAKTKSSNVGNPRPRPSGGGREALGVMPRSRLRGGVVAVIGYILSPLSWWNDLFINIPLAYLFASLVSLASCRLFAPGMVVGYWLTNVIGLFMLHRGGSELLAKSAATRGGNASGSTLPSAPATPR